MENQRLLIGKFYFDQAGTVAADIDRGLSNMSKSPCHNEAKKERKKERFQVRAEKSRDAISVPAVISQELQNRLAC